MGFIKLDRELFESKLWLSEPFTHAQAWVDLIAMANYADKTKFYKGAFQKIKRGQIVTSQQTLADRWKWSRNKVSCFLRSLKDAEMVTTASTTRGTLLTIVNYAFYQDVGSTKSATKAQRKSNAGSAEEQPTDIQEEIKKIRSKEEREHAARAPVSPSLAEVISYQKETGIDVDAEDFWNFYEGSGWMRKGDPIRNWKAVFRSWEGKEKYTQASPAAVTAKTAIDAWLNGGSDL